MSIIAIIIIAVAVILAAVHHIDSEGFRKDLRDHHWHDE